ncbi:MAG: HPr family phosphocarrier protein [Thiohalomonadales bacterium]|nr:HPr family phosphocarrier protein [Thiohalomonadales bacterium]
MIQRQIEIINKLGLHARAAAKFVTLATGFESEVQLSHNGNQVNGKSIMGVMMLAAAKGAQLELLIEGPDEQEAAEKLCELVANRFDEDN